MEPEKEELYEFICKCGRRWARNPGHWLKCHCGANYKPMFYVAPKEEED